MITNGIHVLFSPIFDTDPPTYIVVDGNSPYKHGSNDADWASFTFIFATPEQLGEHVKYANSAPRLLFVQYFLVLTPIS